jgi:hypothetical protein
MLWAMRILGDFFKTSSGHPGRTMEWRIICQYLTFGSDQSLEKGSVRFWAASDSVSQFFSINDFISFDFKVE